MLYFNQVLYYCTYFYQLNFKTTMVVLLGDDDSSMAMKWGVVCMHASGRLTFKMRHEQWGIDRLCLMYCWVSSKLNFKGSPFDRWDWIKNVFINNAFQGFIWGHVEKYCTYLYVWMKMLLDFYFNSFVLLLFEA